MRLVAIGDSSMVGLLYGQIVDRLLKSGRPVKIKFATVELGLVGENDLFEDRMDSEGSMNDSRRSRKKSTSYGDMVNGKKNESAYANHKQLSLEYQCFLVLSEIHKESYMVENRKVLEGKLKMRKKLVFLNEQFRGLKNVYDNLRREHKKLSKSKESLMAEKEELNLQAQGLKESKEIERGRVLGERHGELADAIEKLKSEIKTLKKTKDALRNKVDESEQNLDVMHQGKGFELTKDKLELAGIQVDDDRIFDDDEKLMFLIKQKLNVEQQALQIEEKKVVQIADEIASLGKQLPGMDNNTSAIPVVEKDTSHAGQLEQNIKHLSQQLHDTVTKMAKASKNNEKEKVDEYAARRVSIKKSISEKKALLETLQASQDVQARMKNLPLSAKSKSRKTLPTMSSILDKCPSITNAGGLFENVKSMRGARERWCELDTTGTLHYYKRKGDAQPRGHINMREDTTLEILRDKDSKHLDFVISTSVNQTRFIARNEQDLHHWLDALHTSKAIFDKHNAKNKPKSSSQKDDTLEPRSNSNSGRATLGFQ